MKKLIILCLFIFTIININAKDTTVIQDTAKLTYNKVYNDVKEGLKGLGAALKVGANHVYEIIVKQQFIYSVSNVILYIIFSIVCIWLWIKFSNNNKRLSNPDDVWYKDDVPEHFGLIGIMAFAIILSIILIALFLCTIESTITGFINPEYGAIKAITEFIK